MLADARGLEPESTLETDVCVIGAGPAGITIALELESSGLRVCVLESGDATPTRAAQRLSRGRTASAYYPLDRTRVRGFGGSSNHWMATSGMRARPLDAMDFEGRPEIGLLGWPFDHRHMATYYERAQRICRLGPLDYRVQPRPERGFEPLPLDGSAVETIMFQLGPLDNFPRRGDELAKMAKVLVLLNATATGLVMDESGARVEKVQVATGSGRGLAVRPSAAVLAAGGIENPRLLLLSDDRRPGGLGNDNDLVGRYFMEHPHIRTGVIRLRGPLQERLGFYGWRTEGGMSSYAMLKPTDDALRSEGILASAWAMHPSSELLMSPAGRSLVDLRETIAYRRAVAGMGRRSLAVLRRPDHAARAVLAAAARRRSGESAEPVIQLSVMSEQEPNPESRVTLQHRSDRFGKPLPALRWRMTDLDLRSVRRAQDLLDDGLRRAGMGSVDDKFGDESPPALIGGGFHHMGTTRMHRDPKRGVVDADSRVHSVANLFITGTSVFPTGGYANPTLTVVALAVRLADRIRKELTLA